MNRIDDPKLDFYLRHHALIDEWAGLRKGAQQACRMFLAGLADDVEARATSLDPNVSMRVVSDNGYERLALQHDRWADAAGALVAIAIEWDSGVAFVGGSMPYVGVRVSIDRQTSGEYPTLKDTIGEACNPIPDGWTTSPYWAAWRRVPFADGCWNDLDTTRADLLGALKDTWERFGGPVDRAVAGLLNRTSTVL